MSQSEVDKILEKHSNIPSDDSIFIKYAGKEYILSEEKIKKLTSKFIALCASEAFDRKDFGMNAKVVSMLIDIKKTFYPATQKSIHANIQDFDKELDKWYTLQREIINNKNKDLPIIEIIQDDK